MQLVRLKALLFSEVTFPEAMGTKQLEGFGYTLGVKAETTGGVRCRTKPALTKAPPTGEAPLPGSPMKLVSKFQGR
jgi:hypothetical protein